MLSCFCWNVPWNSQQYFFRNILALRKKTVLFIGLFNINSANLVCLKLFLDNPVTSGRDNLIEQIYYILVKCPKSFYCAQSLIWRWFSNYKTANIVLGVDNNAKMSSEWVEMKILDKA